MSRYDEDDVFLTKAASTDMNFGDTNRKNWRVIMDIVNVVNIVSYTLLV